MRGKGPSVFTSYNYDSDDDTPPVECRKQHDDEKVRKKNAEKSKELASLKMLAMGGNKKSKKKKKKVKQMADEVQPADLKNNEEDETVVEANDQLVKELDNKLSFEPTETTASEKRVVSEVVPVTKFDVNGTANSAESFPQSTSAAVPSSKRPVPPPPPGVVVEPSVGLDPAVRYIPEVIQIVNNTETRSVKMSEIIEIIKSQERHISSLLEENNILTMDNANMRGCLHREIDEKMLLEKELANLQHLNIQYGAEIARLQMELQRANLRSRP